MKKRIVFATQCLALVLVYGTSFSAHGQDDVSRFGTSGNPQVSGTSPSARRATDNTPGFTFNGVLNNALTITGNPDPIGKNFRESVEKVAVLKRKLREAISLNNEKFISEAKSEAKSALVEHFDRELAVQGSILANLSKRADSTASQNQLRRSSKDELINLQLQSYVMEKDTPSLDLGAKNLDEQSLFDLGRMSGPDVTAATPGFGTRSPNIRTAGDPSNPTDASDPNLISVVQFAHNPRNPKAIKAIIESARAKLAEATTTNEESQATDELKAALVNYFDRDLEERDRLLKMVRADIEKMKQKLEKRASSKSSIVELQFKMIVNEASGLGFFSPPVTTDRLDDLKPLSGSSLLPR
jgi:hypothetical protein